LTVAEPVEKVRTTVKEFLLLLVCLSLSLSTVARATKLAHMLAPGTKTLLDNANTPEEVASDDDDSADDASSDEGEDMNDDDGTGAVGDEGTDDDGDDDGSSDEGE
jgi:hypothetical protein